MRAIHLIPPLWEKRLGRGYYKLTFVDWLVGRPSYVELLSKSASYKIVDTQSCEKPSTSSIPCGPIQLGVAKDLINADEVVLPDVMGEPQNTLEASLRALRTIPWDFFVMFVPQARTWDGWLNNLGAFLARYKATGRFDNRLTIGLSGLRQETGGRPQRGTRPRMMKYLKPSGLQMHILGLRSLKEFLRYELPVALECGVRSIDTATAFALGARGLKLTEDTPRLFPLKALQDYDSLGESELSLIEENMDTLDQWVEGETR